MGFGGSQRRISRTLVFALFIQRFEHEANLWGGTFVLWQALRLRRESQTQTQVHLLELQRSQILHFGQYMFHGLGLPTPQDAFR